MISRVMPLALLAVLSFPIDAAAQWLPHTSRSIYVYNVDPRFSLWSALTLFNEGYRQGCADAADQRTDFMQVVLDFGIPSDGTDRNGRRRRGWRSRGFNRYLDPDTVRDWTLWYCSGWMAARSDTGNWADQIMVSIGVSNYDRPGNNGPNGWLDIAHGEQFATVVESFDQALRSPSYAYWGRVFAGGAADIEMCYGSSARTRDWVDAFERLNEVYQNTFVYYGDACGCPQSGATATPARCGCTCTNWQASNSNTWTQADLLHVSWTAHPHVVLLPQIYSTGGGNARQWQQMSLYSYLCSGSRMVLGGPLTQWDACHQPGRSCPGTDNTAVEAWVQLSQRLQSDPRTWQTLYYTSDMKHIERYEFWEPCTP
jgi:hypothetical protein